jgi:acyl-CoA dehydrogenase
MEFSTSERVVELRDALQRFMQERIFPAEAVFEQELAEAPDHWGAPPVVMELKEEARARGLWNLFLPDPELGAGLGNTQYAPLAEVTGWSPFIAPEAVNCAAPDTGNMELLALFGNSEQRERWLQPLLEGEIRSCFSMTEPDVASSDASNVRLRIDVSGEELVLNGRKWWSTGAMRPDCRVALVMGLSDPDAPSGRRHSIVLVPTDTPGFRVIRSTPVFGYDDRHEGGHAELVLDDVRVARQNLLGEQGGGFVMAQARLGPGRIHHCMRLLGMAERALDLMCRRVQERSAFGSRLAEQGVIQEWIADSRIRIEATRLFVLRTAWLMDAQGNKAARRDISAIKVLAPETARFVIDRAIQAFGGAGVSADVPLAALYAQARFLQIADGPDEVHRRSVARAELRRVSALGTQ